MILHEDGFLKLEYDANTDVLSVPCPDIQEFELLHIHKALSIVVDVLTSYDIKRFLFDSSKSRIDVNGAAFNQLLHQLTLGLVNSRLQKLARVVSADAEREQSIAQFLIQAKGQLPYEVQNFSNKAVALHWLTSK
ncbi:hypothetical protein [Pontibacter fetidus]|uniref:STAS/SEC14 domain-containing protein n=1 Tax=Pontibacter fetidus TaxID=2700082 RepID=A0A6B2H4U2_9BACT|nr:hypothetical protein [Pontibacter fetidus]NDK55666.1 hypothetical protein [Pontibacter fetidus]